MKSNRLTFDIAIEIHKLLASGVLQHRIAAIYDVNSGRISEINTGKLFPGSWDVAVGRKRRPREIVPVTFNTIKRLTIKPTALSGDASANR